MSIRHSILISILMFFCACSSEEPKRSPDEQAPEKNEYMYLDFNKWVYHQMNHSYLWREDMPDSLACDYELAPTKFFESLLSPKDRFSYFTNNPNYSGHSEYGFAYQQYSLQNRKNIYEILYVKNPDLKRQGMRRGDIIDIHCSQGFNIYTKLLFDGNAIHSTETTYKEPYGTRNNSTTSTVLLDSIYRINNKKIGYICYLEFDKVADLEKPLKRMHEVQIDNLIIDLRYNPGGLVNTCKYLCNCIVPSDFYDGVFQKCIYNNILSEENIKKNGVPYTLSFYQTPPSVGDSNFGTTVIPLNQKKVIFLTSVHTASASEAAIICLRPYMEVIVVGETTVGKGVGSWTIHDPKYKYAIQPITMRYFNANDETTPDEGLTPDIYVEDGYSTNKREIGDVNETLLNAAINVILGRPVKTKSSVVDNTSLILKDRLIPIGEPSFVTEYKNKQFNELQR